MYYEYTTREGLRVCIFPGRLCVCYNTLPVGYRGLGAAANIFLPWEAPSVRLLL